ncbi:hypothetical protein BD413DRAFT_137092 [Trametes elegans]|nr:hypothetical protein BD413DRAFT_137092 [Trametes elegans]
MVRGSCTALESTRWRTLRAVRALMPAPPRRAPSVCLRQHALRSQILKHENTDTCQGLTRCISTARTGLTITMSSRIPLESAARPLFSQDGPRNLFEPIEPPITQFTTDIVLSAQIHLDLQEASGVPHILPPSPFSPSLQPTYTHTEAEQWPHACCLLLLRALPRRGAARTSHHGGRSPETELLPPLLLPPARWREHHPVEALLQAPEGAGFVSGVGTGRAATGARTAAKPNQSVCSPRLLCSARPSLDPVSVSMFTALLKLNPLSRLPRLIIRRFESFMYALAMRTRMRTSL